MSIQAANRPGAVKRTLWEGQKYEVVLVVQEGDKKLKEPRRGAYPFEPRYYKNNNFVAVGGPALGNGRPPYNVRGFGSDTGDCSRIR